MRMQTIETPSQRLRLLATVGLALILGAVQTPGQSPSSTSTKSEPPWPEITAQTKPWTRWWWMGSAVDATTLQHELETMQEAGLGGVEITPIYGVRGEEENFVSFLTPEWVSLLEVTLQQAGRLGLGVDMATGTGWPFGGPWVSDDDASHDVLHRVFHLREGESLEDPVAVRQEAFLRRAAGDRLNLADLQDPITANEDLQTLAVDQVRFPRPMPLQALMAYSREGSVIDLTRRVDEAGHLHWTAPAGAWTLYAVFQGWHGKMVERAAPGGEGHVIDHFSAEAIRHYLRHFTEAWHGRDVAGVRAFFNDSYEVDDARGQGDWTPRMWREFQKRRGYDLREHLPALFGDAGADENSRVRSDYRETVSDLLLETFTTEWAAWAHGRDAIVRNQAHGSPAHILDLYAASDIPETEGTEWLKIKFASSAAHAAGRPLTSSESATWLSEHFTSTLAEVRHAVDTYFLGGVNHIFFHGSNYSPADADWPGWLFYAAVHFNPRNPWWRDFPALNRYITRAQSFLQAGQPDHDVLVYYPIYDRWSVPGRALLEHFDGSEKPGSPLEPFQATAQAMLDRGYSFDLVSDRQLDQASVTRRRTGPGLVRYQTLLVPTTRLMPVTTFRKLMDLAEDGATIAFQEALPEDVPGWHDLDKRRRSLDKLKDRLLWTTNETAGWRAARRGRGRVLVGGEWEGLLAEAGARRERMADHGLQCLRRYSQGHYDYFVAHRGTNAWNGWLPLQTEGRSALLYDLMQGRAGRARLRQGSPGSVEVFVQLEPGESCVVRVSSEAEQESLRAWDYAKPAGDPMMLESGWSLRFLEGGPELPSSLSATALGSWTEQAGAAFQSFSGTGEYQIEFDRPPGAADHWVLDLGDVRCSASVVLNGEELGTLIGPHYRLSIPSSRWQGRNRLQIRVTNLMANRVADLDRRQVAWKKFYNVNFPPRLRENRGPDGLFSAAAWEPLPSGLLGPVHLQPMRLVP